MSSPTTPIRLKRIQAGKWLTTGYGQSLQRAVASQLRWLAEDCKGSLLLETVIAMMIFALVGVAVLAGLSTVYSSGAKTEEQSVAENLARNQVEAIFSGPYREPNQTPYATITGIPTNYSLSSSVDFEDAVDPDPEVETVSVTASHNGQDIISLNTLRGRDDGLQLRYSVLPNRTLSERLRGADIGLGTVCACQLVYVFLDDPELAVNGQVDFYLDGAYIQTENFLYWDFEGSLGVLITDEANPWDTATSGNGAHTIKASALLNDGNTVNVTADFTVSN